MKTVLLIVLGIFVLVLVFDLARLWFIRWRWQKVTRQLVKDVAWRHWIGLVKVRAGLAVGRTGQDYALEASLARDAEWFHALWAESGPDGKKISPNAAVEKWLAEKSDTRLAKKKQ